MFLTMFEMHKNAPSPTPGKLGVPIFELGFILPQFLPLPNSQTTNAINITLRVLNIWLTSFLSQGSPVTPDDVIQEATVSTDESQILWLGGSLFAVSPALCNG